MHERGGQGLRGCHRCGLVQRLGPVPAGYEARCPRCEALLSRAGGAERRRLCAALALAALICYPLGISLPVLRLEQMGHVHEASIWAGSLSLMTHGQVVVGLVVFVCSVVLPLVKLAGLLVLLRRPGWLAARHQAGLYRAVELAGRWGMIDVLLAAVLVAALKLGDLVSVAPGPGLLAFTACVMLSLLAAACFEPHTLWSDP